MSIDICPDYGDIVSELTKENEELQASIAELEAFIDQLIEAGDAVVEDYCNETLSPYGSQIVRIWQLLVEDLKERKA